MSRNFFNVSAIYRGSQELDALYWGQKLKWRRDFQGQLPLANYSSTTIKLTSDLTVNLGMTQDYPCGVVVDWGDSTTPDIFEPISGFISHTYAIGGLYEIKIYTYSGNTWGPGYIASNTEYSFLSAPGSKESDTILRSFIFGDNCYLSSPRAFYNSASLQEIDLSTQSNIPKYTFYGCTALNSVIFGEHVESINESAFENCVSLNLREIPDSVTFIGNRAFAGCTSLPIYLELKSSTIQAYAFHNCTQLKRVWLRNSVNVITSELVTVRNNSYYYGPFSQCDDNLTIYAEPVSRPVNWDEYFNYNGKYSDHGLLVIWSTQDRPQPSITAVWHAQNRVLEYQDLHGDETGYEYNSEDQSLVIY